MLRPISRVIVRKSTSSHLARIAWLKASSSPSLGFAAHASKRSSSGSTNQTGKDSSTSSSSSSSRDDASALPPGSDADSPVQASSSTRRRGKQTGKQQQQGTAKQQQQAAAQQPPKQCAAPPAAAALGTLPPAPPAAFTTTAAPNATAQTAAAAAAAPAAAAPAAASDQPSLSELLPVPAAADLAFSDSPFQLRDYQVDCIQQVVCQWKSGTGVQLVMLPTGCGKTVVFAALARFMAEHYVPRPEPPATASADEAAAASADEAEAAAEAGATAAEAAAEAQQLGPPSSAAAAAAGAGHSAEAAAATEVPPGIEQAAAEGAVGRAYRSSRARRGKGSNPAVLPVTSERSSSTDNTVACSSVGSIPLYSSSNNDISADNNTPSRSGRPSSSETHSSVSTIASSSNDVSSSNGSSSSTDTSSSTSGGGSRARSGKRRVAAGQQQQQQQQCPDGSMRVLVLAHRHDLLHQAEDKFSLMWPGCTISWVKGLRKEFYGQVVVASVATAVNVIDQLVGCRFSLVVVDEAHHSVAATYKTLLKGLGFIEDIDSSSRPGSTPGSSSNNSSDSDTELQQQQQQQAWQQQAWQQEQQQQREEDWQQQDSDQQQQQQQQQQRGWQQHQQRRGWQQQGLQQFYQQVQALSGTSSSSSTDPSPSSPATSREDCDAEDESLLETGSSSSSSSSSDDSAAAAAPAWVPTIRGLSNPNALLVGFTATPYRMREADSKELYTIFSHVFTKNITDMIRDKYLCKILSRKVFTHVNLRGVGSSPGGGDFVLSRLSPVVNSPSRNTLVLSAYIDYCTEPIQGTAAATETAGTAAARAAGGGGGAGGVVGAAVQGLSGSSSSSSSSSATAVAGKRRGKRSSGGDDASAAAADAVAADGSAAAGTAAVLTVSGRRPVRKALGFAVDIAHAEALNATFQAAGVRSAAVHSMLPFEETKQHIQAFRRGELDVLFNCEKLTEGFDEPSIDAVLMARPTKSTGLYTQMLGRGLRRAPGKDNCIVLDFTDTFHRADRIVDVRVLLADPGCYRNMDPPPPAEKDRTHKVETKGLTGGEMSVLGEELDPRDFVWVKVGARHWMQNLFSSGNLWLVNVADMGPQQKQLLGLKWTTKPARPEAAAEAVQTPPAQAAAHEYQQGLDDIDSVIMFSDEDGEEDTFEQQDRYVVLHQQKNNPNPTEWKNVAPLAVNGMSESDAYGAAIDYMQQVVRSQQVQAVAAWKSGWKKGSGWQGGSSGGSGGRPFLKVDLLRKDAQWRSKPMSDKQRSKLKDLGVSLPADARLTSGEAGEMITKALVALATPQQVEQLQAAMPPEEWSNLPVPLLAHHAASLLG